MLEISPRSRDGAEAARRIVLERLLVMGDARFELRVYTLLMLVSRSPSLRLFSLSLPLITMDAPAMYINISRDVEDMKLVKNKRVRESV